MLKSKRPYNDIDWHNVLYIKNNELYWKERDISFFTKEKYMNTWNAKNANKIAGNVFTPTNSKTKYRRLSYNKKNFLAHRIIIIMEDGFLEDSYEVDHIDRNGINNNIENLRIVKHIDNCRNRGIQSNNKSGHSGITYRKKQNKFVVRIGNKGKQFGSYARLSDAVSRRLELEAEFKYHENHGKKI